MLYTSSMEEAPKIKTVKLQGVVSAEHPSRRQRTKQTDK